MLEVLGIIIVLILFDIINKIIDKKNRKYNYSPIYLRIETIYNDWYSKKWKIINNHKASAIKIRETIFDLVEALRKDGLKKEDITEYYNIISVSPKRNHWYTAVAGILTVISGNEIIKSLSSNLYKELSKIDWLNQVLSINSLNNQIVSSILYILLLLILTFLFLRFSYILITSDNFQKNNIKKAIFKEVKSLYEENTVDKDNTDLRSSFDIAINSIKLIWTKKLEQFVAKLIKKPNFLRFIFVVGIFLIPAVIIDVIDWQINWKFFWLALILNVIFLFFMSDYIYSWYKSAKLNNDINSLFENPAYENVENIMQSYNFKLVENNNTRVQFQYKNIKININKSNSRKEYKPYQIEDLEKGLRKAQIEI